MNHWVCSSRCAPSNKSICSHFRHIADRRGVGVLAEQHVHSISACAGRESWRLHRVFQRARVPQKAAIRLVFRQMLRCYSMIGRYGGRQGISIGEGCERVSGVIPLAFALPVAYSSGGYRTTRSGVGLQMTSPYTFAHLDMRWVFGMNSRVLTLGNTWR